ncbi:MAG: TMEM165/GDT1 family protein [Candidatus Thiodiazotropha sp. (ex Ctena orbiculata)]|nr:TMEM165/GDT1 family protein [Candidatus Thiodiazotropha taylori]
MKQFFAVFIMVFLAELGDKTQLATMMFASGKMAHPLLIFIGASLALIAASALAVLVGHAASQYLDTFPLQLVAGIGFVALGAWMVVEHFGVIP